MGFDTNEHTNERETIGGELRKRRGQVCVQALNKGCEVGDVCVFDEKSESEEYSQVGECVDARAGGECTEA